VEETKEFIWRVIAYREEEPRVKHELAIELRDEKELIGAAASPSGAR